MVEESYDFARSFDSLRMTTWEGDGRGLMEMAGMPEWVLAEAVFFEFALEGFPVDAQEF